MKVIRADGLIAAPPSQNKLGMNQKRFCVNPAVGCPRLCRQTADDGVDEVRGVSVRIANSSRSFCFGVSDRQPIQAGGETPLSSGHENEIQP